MNLKKFERESLVRKCKAVVAFGASWRPSARLPRPFLESRGGEMQNCFLFKSLAAAQCRIVFAFGTSYLQRAEL